MTHAHPDPAAPTVADLQEGFASGRLSAEQAAAACLDRIAAENPRLNAIIIGNPEAMAEARAIDARRAAGEALGPLAGVPVVVKDTMDMAGFPSTGGWSLLCARTGGVDLLPGTDAPVVARLRAAGAVILGKTNVPVLSASGTHANNSWAGPTLNAVAPDLVPGGSSAGTATAVAAGMAVLGLAEETGGSIQNPAAAQGLVGIKPSFGLVPNAGVMPLASQRDVVGPIARCVRDAALTLDVLAGFTTEDPKTVAGVGNIPDGGYAAQLSPTALAGRRIGLYGPGWRDQPLSAETADLYAAAQAVLRARGAVLVDDPFAGSGFAALRRPVSDEYQFDARGLESVAHDLQRYLERLGPRAALRSFADFARATAAKDAFAPGGTLHYLHLLPEFAAALADPLLPPPLREFTAVRAAYRRIFDAVMRAQRLDALVFPQARSALPALHAGRQIAETTVSEINIAGLPGVTFPAGRHASGAPFGLILVGGMWSEAALLAMAFDYETATGGGAAG
ncbi:amidase [Paracraurococcus ruber]|uniref:Amidase n=1 Tax=Paracraurococcus ruber TaxID=77675 RepID=A0ABS1D9Q0_9PROT|nr:amidase [Paracraurococcus ruber]MBK1662614.1 amidase [Paracraurococcus ruber]TDG16248.1 amidase [Paracraurococcus ruber]